MRYCDFRKNDPHNLIDQGDNGIGYRSWSENIFSTDNEPEWSKKHSVASLLTELSRFPDQHNSHCSIFSINQSNMVPLILFLNSTKNVYPVLHDLYANGAVIWIFHPRKESRVWYVPLQPCTRLDEGYFLIAFKKCVFFYGHALLSTQRERINGEKERENEWEWTLMGIKFSWTATQSSWNVTTFEMYNGHKFMFSTTKLRSN